MDTSTVVARAPMATDTLGRRIAPRRFLTVAEKRRIVQDLAESGCSAAEIARRHGVNANLLFAWRRLQERGLLAEHTRRVRKPLAAKLLAVQVVAQSPVPPPASSAAYIEVALPGGIRVRGFGAVERSMWEQVLSLLQR